MLTLLLMSWYANVYVSIIDVVFFSHANVNVGVIILNILLVT